MLVIHQRGVLGSIILRSLKIVIQATLVDNDKKTFEEKFCRSICSQMAVLRRQASVDYGDKSISFLQSVFCFETGSLHTSLQNQAMVSALTFLLQVHQLANSCFDRKRSLESLDNFSSCKSISTFGGAVAYPEVDVRLDKLYMLCNSCRSLFARPKTSMPL